jgi:hypothetical protein
VIVASIDRVAAVPSGVVCPIRQRWFSHLVDPLDGVALGLAPSDVPGPIPGRIFVPSIGLERS